MVFRLLSHVKNVWWQEHQIGPASIGQFCGQPRGTPAGRPAHQEECPPEDELDKLNDPRDNRHIPTMELAAKTGRAVLSQWSQMNTQMMSTLVKEKEVVRRVFVLWTRMEEVASGGKKKASGKRKKYGQAGEQRKAFVASLDKLFDIVSCQCTILSCSEFSCSDNCKAGVHIDCSCPKETRIPALELEFINDQRKNLVSKAGS